jgi:hypothetical protein
MKLLVKSLSKQSHLSDLQQGDLKHQIYSEVYANLLQNKTKLNPSKITSKTPPTDLLANN